tara:strand:+ start:412 stop:621 length:210 start_codon:yes stop_codon:yes gene_type:complete
MNKDYTIAVYTMVFYCVDEDGNEELNEDGSIKLYKTTDHYDCSSLAEAVELHDLEELFPRGGDKHAATD